MGVRRFSIFLVFTLFPFSLVHASDVGGGAPPKPPVYAVDGVDGAAHLDGGKAIPISEEARRTGEAIDGFVGALRVKDGTPTTFEAVWTDGPNGKKVLSGVKIGQGYANLANIAGLGGIAQMLGYQAPPQIFHSAPAGGFCSSTPSSIESSCLQQWGPAGQQAINDCVFQQTHFASYACEAEKAAEKAEPREDGTPPPPPAAAIPPVKREDSCVGQAQMKATQCRAAAEKANIACNSSNYPQLQSAQSQGQSTANSLQGQQSTNSSCGQTQAFSDDYISALRGYERGCSQGVADCSVCDSLNQELNSCAGTNHVREQIQPSISSCQNNRNKASQAATQAQSAENTRRDAAACFQTSTASQAQNQFGKPGAGQVAANGGAPPLAGGTGAPGVSSIAGGPSEARAGGDGSGDPEYDTSSGLDDLKKLEFPAVEGSAGVALASAAGGGGASEASPLASDDESSSSEDKKGLRKKSSWGDSGGGRRLRRSPSNSKEDPSLFSSAAIKEAAQKAGLFPDLRAFLPQVKGQGKAFDGHGPHANIFEKMHIRYNAVSPTLIKDADAPAKIGP